MPSRREAPRLLILVVAMCLCMAMMQQSEAASPDGSSPIETAVQLAEELVENGRNFEGDADAAAAFLREAQNTYRQIDSQLSSAVQTGEGDSWLEDFSSYGSERHDDAIPPPISAREIRKSESSPEEIVQARTKRLYDQVVQIRDEMNSDEVSPWNPGSDELLAGIMAEMDLTENPPTWLSRIWNHIAKRVKKLWDRITGYLENEMEGVESVTRVIVLTMVAAFTLVLLFMVVRRLAPLFTGKPRRRRTHFSRDLSPEDVNALELAREARLTGEYIPALHYLMLHLLERLEFAGLVRRDRSKTNWEYFREARQRNPDVLSSLVEVGRTFDKKLYGGESCSEAEVAGFEESVIALADRVESECVSGTGGEKR